MPISKDDLLKPRIGEGTVDIEGLGQLTIRPLTRAQAMQVHASDTLAEGEALLLHFGLVEPALTLAEVKAWAHSAPAGEQQAVSQAIGLVSGMGPSAGKESYKSVRAKS